MKGKLTVSEVKRLGKEKNRSNFELLLELYYKENSVEVKREIVSSIGRYSKLYNDEVFEFIEKEIFFKNYMDIIYQFYRTLLYNYNIEKYKKLADRVEKFYDNEMIKKMKQYFFYKREGKKLKKVKTRERTLILEGDSLENLKSLEENSVNLIFTSPPYYNAREYSDYTSYNKYLEDMKNILKECNRVLEQGRFIIINVSPVITKRTGREFESIRYPIHFDFHKILSEVGFYFIDEILWIKPEPSVPNRVGGYIQTRKPLSYKPNCITESVLVYRKKCDFLLDKNIALYDKIEINYDQKVDTSNCWYIAPASDKLHPAIFPQELCKRVLKYYSFEGDVVLDPFAGSGSFGIAALEMNRIPILCEINKKYINYIKERIKEYDYIRRESSN